MIPMKKLLRLIFLLTFLPFISADGQDPDLKDVFLEAESYFLFEEYNEALPLYLRIHRADPENDNINYKIGVCFLNDPYQKEKSIRYLEEAAKNTNPDFKINKYKERTAPLEAFFYLGKAYLVNNNIEKALENFEQFRSILDEKIYDVELVDEQIRICRAALDLRTKPVDFDIRNLGETINTRFADMNPVLSGDGTKLVYVSKLAFYDATFFSEKVNGQWQPPRNIIPELGVDGDVYPTSLSYDGTTMIIYRNDDFIGNLYTSKYVDGRWTAMTKIGGHISTKYWESHGCLTKDGNTLYFTSNRKGGYGGLDIYRSDLQPNGEWGEPVNLGPVVNTRYNEETPFITQNGQYLFFSSYGHYNMGGYDVFMSKKDENGEWDRPINLGYPINTTDDNIFYFPVDNGNSAFYSMYSEGGYGRHDLYFLDVYSNDNPRMYAVKGSLFAEDGLISDADDVRIFLIDESTGDTITIASPDLADNSFLLTAPKGIYDLQIRSNTFSDVNETLTIDENTDKAGIELSDRIVLETKPVPPRLLTGDESRIILDDTLITAVAGKPLKIKMRLEKDAELVASIFRDSLLAGSDTFAIDRRRFTYEMVPEEGNNTIEFTLTESNGDVSLKTLVVKGLLPVGIAEGPTMDSAEAVSVTDTDAIRPEPPINLDSLNAALRQIIERVKPHAGGNLLQTLETLVVEELGVNSTKGLLDSLESFGKVRGYTPAELDEAVGKTIAGEDVNLLKWVLKDVAPAPLADFLSTVDIDTEGLGTVDQLMQYIRGASDDNAYTDNDIRTALAEGLNSGISAAEKFKYALLRTAKEPLRGFLDELNLDSLNIRSEEAFLGYMSRYTGQKPDGLREYLMANGPESLRKYIEAINLESEGIQTLSDLVRYLLKHIDETGLTREELMALLASFLEEALSAYNQGNPFAELEKTGKPGIVALSILLSSGFITFVFFILFRRRRKNKEE
jgi:Tol biopolymer transport system component